MLLPEKSADSTSALIGNAPVNPFLTPAPSPEPSEPPELANPQSPTRSTLPNAVLTTVCLVFLPLSAIISSVILIKTFLYSSTYPAVPSFYPEYHLGWVVAFPILTLGHSVYCITSLAFLPSLLSSLSHFFILLLLALAWAGLAAFVLAAPRIDPRFASVAPDYIVLVATLSIIEAIAAIYLARCCLSSRRKFCEEGPRRKVPTVVIYSFTLLFSIVLSFTTAVLLIVLGPDRLALIPLPFITVVHNAIVISLEIRYYRYSTVTTSTDGIKSLKILFPQFTYAVWHISATALFMAAWSAASVYWMLRINQSAPLTELVLSGLGPVEAAATGLMLSNLLSVRRKAHTEPRGAHDSIPGFHGGRASGDLPPPTYSVTINLPRTRRGR